jgi:hypothetical protein
LVKVVETQELETTTSGKMVKIVQRLGLRRLVVVGVPMVKVVAGLQEMGVQGVVDKVKYAKKMMVVVWGHLDRGLMVVTDERE